MFGDGRRRSSRLCCILEGEGEGEGLLFRSKHKNTVSAGFGSVSPGN